MPASILRWMTDLRWQLAAPIYRHVENMSEQLVAESVEGSFDAEEFVDGAKSAGVCAVHFTNFLRCCTAVAAARSMCAL